MKRAAWIAGFIAVMYVYQCREYYDRIGSDLEKRIALAREDLMRAAIFGQGDGVFARLQREQLEELEALRHQVPKSLEVQPFIESFEAWAIDAGVRVEDTSHEQEDLDFYERARITSQLESSEDAIANLMEARGELARLVEWVDESSTPEGVEIALFIFSVPASKTEGYQSSCLNPPDVEALWPETQRIAALHSELVEVCERVEEQKEMLVQVASYLHMEEEVEKLHRFVDFIQSSSQHNGVP
jgi:hypothetical protein